MVGIIDLLGSWKRNSYVPGGVHYGSDYLPRGSLMSIGGEVGGC